MEFSWDFHFKYCCFYLSERLKLYLFIQIPIKNKKENSLEQIQEHLFLRWILYFLGYAQDFFFFWVLSSWSHQFFMLMYKRKSTDSPQPALDDLFSLNKEAIGITLNSPFFQYTGERSNLTRTCISCSHWY